MTPGEMFWTGFGANALLLSAVTFLCRSMFSHWLNKDVELFKEKLRHSLELAKTEHQIRFSHLYEKRFSKVAEIHKELRLLIDSLLDSLKLDLTTKAQRFKDAVDKREKLLQTFLYAEIYLPADFCKKLSETLFKLSLSQVELEATDNTSSTPYEERKAAVESFAAILRQLNGELVSAARDIIELKA